MGVKHEHFLNADFIDTRLPLGYAKAKIDLKKIFILHLQPKMGVIREGGYTRRVMHVALQYTRDGSYCDA